MNSYNPPYCNLRARIYTKDVWLLLSHVSPERAICRSDVLKKVREISFLHYGCKDKAITLRRKPKTYNTYRDEKDIQD